ncbi:MAG TPA: YajQ family cyclic di-GMP-binding protein [Nitrospirales bacterium]|nr:YajQ family cyclic di-GMP-binding protein [Nitrospirales bacterium]HIA14831.1 YajQ family cyclic di-GMP-binding protein [Nitrospirales bacterium]HIB54024.1 YajQ family cyclic di-GMP-binding protein [Nitrospirales bacterium]HIC04017.1 YajQ family cyclic di-GMP-binding protein [Nitrospirales bacterium]HIO20792.1 YajQ family cyclic di-GMP-binding protein [Nitrospirales bacterium]
MPSFDVISEVDTQEVTNAVDQATRELGTRFDFKGTDAKFELGGTTVTMRAPSDFQLKQLFDILTKRLSSRSIDIRCLQLDPPQINVGSAWQVVKVRQGIETELAKKMVKMIKNEKFKVQAAIQGDKVRVSGKKRDDLQEVIAFLKEADLGMPLQFDNYRD